MRSLEHAYGHVDHEHASAERAVSPGKRTLTSRLPAGGAPAAERPTVESEREAAPPYRDAPPHDDPFGLHLIADQGVTGAGGSLPHLEAIQRSFGPAHDISHVVAHVGGAAGEAAEELGASAYATGSRIGFRQAPDLFTAAHEAAHVVQQRQGVSLRREVGDAGDSYEQHADAVAERVVRGESAAELLAASPRGGATRALQLQPDREAPPLSAKRAEAIREMNRIKDLIAANGGAIYSDDGHGGDNGLFTSLTNTDHGTLKKDWTDGAERKRLAAKKQAGTITSEEEKELARLTKENPNSGGMTACNNFAGKFGATTLHTNKQTSLGVFGVASRTAGAFVRPGEGRHPRPGDVVKMSGMHMCVSFNAPSEGKPWQVLEAGQGGPPVHDALMFNTRAFIPADIEGWVDIDEWAKPEVQDRASVAAKLIGTWTWNDGNGAWHYTFDPTGTRVTAVQGSEHTEGTWAWNASTREVELTWKTGVERWPFAGVDVGHGKGHGAWSATFDKRAAPALPPMATELQKHRFDVKVGEWRHWRYAFYGRDELTYTDAKKPADAGGHGTWVASGRTVTITFDTGTKEVWKVPVPLAGKFDGELVGGALAGQKSKVTVG